METIFDALRADHDLQRDLVKNLVKTSGDSDERTQLFESLKSELTAHAAAEEKFFYRPLMEHDLTLEKARHSVAEHKELDDLLESLGKTDMSSSGWLIEAKKLKERLTHHLDEEEHEVFQMAGKALNELQKTACATAYDKEKEKRT